MFTKKLLDSGKIELKSGRFVAKSTKNGCISQDENIDICRNLLYMHYFKKDTNRIISMVIDPVIENKIYKYRIYAKEIDKK